MITSGRQLTTDDRTAKEILADAEKSGWLFLRDMACTWDEHDQTAQALSKPFPVKLYIRVVCRCFVELDILFIEKTRQIMITWIMAGLYLWETMTLPARRSFFQSKEQEAANGVLDRARHIYNEILRSGASWIPKAKMMGDQVGTSNKLYFPKVQSIIHAIPQGGDVGRSWTISRIYADEMNHQPKFEASYESIQPAIKGGGRYNAVGTPNGKNFAWRMMNGMDDAGKRQMAPHEIDSRRVTARLFDPPTELSPAEARMWIENTLLDLSEEEFNAIPLEELIACIPGMEYRKTAHGVHVLSVHYTADPDKDPVMPQGREWIANEKRGMSKNKWRKEYEIDYTAFSGQPVIGDYDESVHVQPVEYDPNYPLHLFVDFGKNCFCGFGQFVPIEGTSHQQARILDEIYLEKSNTLELIEETIKLLKEKYPDCYNDGFPKVEGSCDPAGHQERETTADTSRNSSIKLFAEYGIFLTAQKYGVQESVDFVDTLFSRQYETPNGLVAAVVVAPHCEYMRAVFGGGWRYPEGDKGTFQKPDKDGHYEHGGDGSRYWLCNNLWERDVAVIQRTAPVRRIARRCPVTGRIRGYKTVTNQPRKKRTRRRTRPGQRLTARQCYG